MNKAISIIQNLPDPDSASRFLASLAETQPNAADRLLKNDALLSDVLTLVSFSPLFSTTLLQNPGYIWWLDTNRTGSGVRNKSELLESLARFSLTNSQVDPHIIFARFRRRELLRIFLRDIRRLSTVAETTEEISNLADAILENALRLARQDLDNRFGAPLESDGKGRERPAEFCVVSLGKLGSRELNYASDIDLLFIYSGEGSTSGVGSRGKTTNREYFVKLAENISKLVGQQSGEGAAYRVDMRLRPHGRVGSLTLSVRDTVAYYNNEAADWERQVLIRSRASAGDAGIYTDFFKSIESSVFAKSQTVQDALAGVRASKEKIDLENRSQRGFDVKLGTGGIREIEFIAQALQLAHGGRDKWLRVSHTLKSLARLADRKLVTESELTELFEAYEFLRHLEHMLQMENGLQTHAVPEETGRRLLTAKRMNFTATVDFDAALVSTTRNVNRIFVRVFGTSNRQPESAEIPSIELHEDVSDSQNNTAIFPSQLLYSLQRSGVTDKDYPALAERLNRFITTSPRIVEILAADPTLIKSIPASPDEYSPKDYWRILTECVGGAKGYRKQISNLRKEWTRLLLEILAFDVFEKISLYDAKRLQTELAEATIEAALMIARVELERIYKIDVAELNLAVLGLGKLGGGGLDYDSDLDIVFVYDQYTPAPTANASQPGFYGQAVEIFINAVSSVMRGGSLYRVDLRLRPHGKNGPTAISRSAFNEYMLNDAAIWELLAYVKIRGVGSTLARSVEKEIKGTIHERAFNIDVRELAIESARIRAQLENEKSASRRGEIDIKFGAGGMLDVYFAVRYLQLRDNVPDEDGSRSTSQTLRKLLEKGSLSESNCKTLSAGYDFLSVLDHNIRLTVGRSNRLPLANQHALRIIAGRMKFDSAEPLIEQLTIHRLNIRSAYEQVLAS